MRNLLKGKGYKATPARIEILDILNKSKKPLNAELVYQKIKNKNINKTTVYRTLSSLSESEILKIVDLHKDSVFFELQNKHHHHIICTDCDLVEDIENIEVEKVLSKIKISSSKFKNIKEHSLEFFGICKECS